MAYYLTVKRNNDYHNIDLSVLEEFTRMSKFKNGSYSLDEIDKCTSKFSDEVSFKKSLYENGLIELDDITRELSIRMKNKDKLEKVRYGLVYGNIKKYLDDIYLRGVFLVLRNDNDFLGKLVSNYRNSYSNTVKVAEIKNYLFDNCNFRIDIYRVLNEFFFNEVYREDRETGEALIKYKSLHDLAMFVHNYSFTKEMREKGKTDLLEGIVRSRELLELKKEMLMKCGICISQPKQKKLTKSDLNQIPVEGQISFFD